MITTPLLDGNYWEASRSGLLAGERLMNDLRYMERRFMETYYRGMEIDQAFSLMQIDPAALLKLKATGECELTIPELYFDLFYPGQYCCRIKSARLTIPCITGPYTNISATLSLKGSQIRKDPELGDQNIFDVPPNRSITIATSNAQNDAGVFRLDFRDERYMPFEGAGAVNSVWSLSLPKTFRLFDYATINDVIIHISYTAEYDENFRSDVEVGRETIRGELDRYLTTESIPRMFSFRQECSQTFHRLLHSPSGEPVPLELSEKHFPLFLQGRELEITGAKLILEIEEAQMRDESGSPLPINITLTIQGNDGNMTVNIFTSDVTFGMPSTTIHDGSDPSTSIFQPFRPSSGPLAINLIVNDAGNFAPTDASPSDPSSIDDHKLKDIYIYLEYRVQPEST